MNNKMRKEIKFMLEDEIFLYNENVKKYNHFKDIDPVSFDAAANSVSKYLHSLSTLLRTVNLCDSMYDYSLKFESCDFYSVCTLNVKKVEG